MLAMAVARELGVSVEDAARGIAAMPPPPMRVELASSIGARDADQRRLQLESRVRRGPRSSCSQHAGAGRQRVAVLGTMLELGPHDAAAARRGGARGAGESASS